jgi:hypothetical protein
MLSSLYAFQQFLQPIMVPLCFVTAWGLVFLIVANLWSLGRDGLQVTQKLHQIPCARCQFFTQDYHLKCTIHPCEALTEEAINCHDYQPQS